MERFKSIFEGLDVAYGQHQSQGKRADGKQEGKSYIVKQEVRDDLWTEHLNGNGPSLGIIPIMADNTVRWGCICLLYTSPSPRDRSLSRMPSSA